MIIRIRLTPQLGRHSTTAWRYSTSAAGRRVASRTSSGTLGVVAQQEDPGDDHPATERKDGKPFHAAESAGRNAACEQQHGRGHRQDAQRQCHRPEPTQRAAPLDQASQQDPRGAGHGTTSPAGGGQDDPEKNGSKTGVSTCAMA